MASQTQVYALKKLLQRGCDLYYQNMIHSAKKQLEKLKDEYASLFSEHPERLLQLHVVKIEPSGHVFLEGKLPESFFTKLDSILSQIEALEDEWHSELEKIEDFINFKLVSKDDLIDEVEMPDRFKEYLKVVSDRL